MRSCFPRWSLVHVLVNVVPLPASEAEYVCVYQVPWGDNIFLLPLDFKCLLDDYGQCEYLPNVIKAPVIEVDDYRLSPNNRKRYKFLSHLPLQSVFSFVEVDLKELVTAETLNYHRAEFREREKYRQVQKEKEEELAKLMPQKYHLLKEISQRLGDFVPEVDYRSVQEFPILIEEETKAEGKCEEKQEVNSIWTEENISKQKGNQYAQA